MPEHKLYEPTAEDFALAESMMTDEQREMSAEREAFKFQVVDAFEDHLAHIDKDDERRAASPEEVHNMDERMRKLGELFDGSDIRWNLDGAFNISIMGGKYIGVHKDVDISVEAADLPKFDGLLMKHGYGLFLSSSKDESDPRSPKILERVGAERFAAADLEHRLIASVDEPGAVSKVVDDLNFIDVHLVTRNAAGRVLGGGGALLPEKWSTPIKKEFQGYELNLSHPGKLAFFKLHESRVYDRTDLKKLAELGVLTTEDMADIENSFEAEFAARRRESEVIVTRIMARVTPEMNVKQVVHEFAVEPAIAARINSEETPALNALCAAIVELKDRDVGRITDIAMDKFGVQKKFDGERAKVAELRKWVEEREKAK